VLGGSPIRTVPTQGRKSASVARSAPAGVPAARSRCAAGPTIRRRRTGVAPGRAA